MPLGRDSAFHGQDGRIGGHPLEDLQVAKIDYAFDGRLLQKVFAQGLARSGLEEGVRGNVAQAPARFQQAQAAFVEIAVEIGPVGNDLIPLFQIGFQQLQKFHPHIGRVAQDHVEAAFSKDAREGRFPGEGVIEIGEVAVLNQAVTDADAARQAVQNLAAPGGLDPERQLGDLDAFLVYVYAEEVVGQNFAVGDVVEQIAKMFDLG